jgi:hypothetical protein
MGLLKVTPKIIANATQKQRVTSILQQAKKKKALYNDCIHVPFCKTGVSNHDHELRLKPVQFVNMKK